MSAQDDVLALLAEAGFAGAGQLANPGVVRYVAGHAVGGRFSYRMKFRRGDIGVTVGKRTTCVYRIGDSGPVGFQNFKTRDVDSVRDALLLALSGG